MHRAIAIALAGLILALCGRVASAADLPTKGPLTYPPYDFGINWTGFYAGLSGGVGLQKFKGPIGTGTIGINFQTYSRFVLGLEGDVSIADLRDDPACATCDFKTRWLTTERARIGYAFDRMLIFATGGIAIGNFQSSSLIGSTNTTKTGFAVGGGVEFDLGQNWSLRGDYLHLAYGAVTCCGGVSTVRADDDVVRVGFVFRFFQAGVEEFTLGNPGTKPPPPR